MPRRERSSNSKATPSAPGGDAEAGATGREHGHRSLAHTADVILEAWGPDLASCCREAAAALVGTYVDKVNGEYVGERFVHVPPAPPEAQVFRVLEELIFTLDTSDDVPVAVDVRGAADGGLVVELKLVRRRSVDATGAVPKALSRSGLLVETGLGRVFCRFLVDL